MNRTDAATTLLRWQLQGERELVRATATSGQGTLLSIVEAVAPTGPVPPPPPEAIKPSVDFLRLDEERAIEGLRRWLRLLATVLRPEEVQRLEAQVAPNLMPAARIHDVQPLVERFASRVAPVSLQRDFEAHFGWADAGRPHPVATPLVSLLLFSRDGRELACEGPTTGLDTSTLSALVARAEAGSTWRLSHQIGTLVGHVGTRAAIVAVFRDRPVPNAGGALRVSLESLERKERLVNALGHAGGHEALGAFLRAVRVLLHRNA